MLANKSIKAATCCEFFFPFSLSFLLMVQHHHENQRLVRWNFSSALCVSSFNPSLFPSISPHHYQPHSVFVLLIQAYEDLVWLEKYCPLSFSVPFFLPSTVSLSISLPAISITTTFIDISISICSYVVASRDPPMTLLLHLVRHRKQRNWRMTIMTMLLPTL